MARIGFSRAGRVRTQAQAAETANLVASLRLLCLALIEARSQVILNQISLTPRSRRVRARPDDEFSGEIKEKCAASELGWLPCSPLALTSRATLSLPDH
jgi:hypothetical protein